MLVLNCYIISGIDILNYFWFLLLGSFIQFLNCFVGRFTSESLLRQNLIMLHGICR